MNTVIREEDRKRVSIAIVAVLVLLAVFLGVKSVNALQEGQYIGQDATHTITVSGDGEVFAIPDTAEFSFSVSKTADTVAEAQTDVTNRMNEILAYLKDQGIDEKDIKTIGYNVYPQYEYRTVGAPCVQGYCPPGNQVLTGYTVEHTVSVKVRDTQKAGTLLSAIGSKNVSNVSGLNFTIGDDDAYKAQARSQAIAEARANAEALARSLGVHIVRVAGFNETSNGYPMPIYMARDSVGGAKEVAPAAPDLPTGQNQITSHVQVTYEIR